MLAIELVAAVRAELGKLPPTNKVDIEDTDIVREAGWILNRISQKINKKALRYVTSVANQRDYDVNISTIRVQLVLPPDEITDYRLKLGDYIIGEQNIDDEYYNFPSLWTMDMARRTRGLSKIQWTFNPIERKLKIDPAPSEDGQKIYYISVEAMPWTIATTPADFELMLVTGTVWKCLEIVMMRRTTEGGIQRAGGQIDYPADRLRYFIEAKKNEFFEDLRLQAMIYSI